jgi:hypothetical protein
MTAFTVERCIKSAMLDAGLIQRGDTPTVSDYAEMMDRLNDICITEQTQGLKLWLNEMQDIVLVAGTYVYPIGPATGPTPIRPMRVLEAYTTDVNGTSSPLTMLSWNDWNLLGGRYGAGSLHSFFVDKGLDYMKVHVAATPDAQAATSILQVLVQGPVAHMTAISDRLDFPIEWFLFLRWALAADIATGQPQAVIDRCEGKAMQLRQALTDWDVEDASTLFSPSGQSGFSGSAFR